MTPDRTLARALASEYNARDDPIGWFEVLYDRALATAKGTDAIPWADLAPSPHLVSWLDAHDLPPSRRRALKVGCGLGDDAEELARRGFEVTAFDVAPTAIHWCRWRFPSSPVSYVCCDLFDLPPDWQRAFDLVVEAYTLQVLPPHVRSAAMQAVTCCVAPGGLLLVISRGREQHDPEGLMPWPLVRSELAAFAQLGMEELCFDAYIDQEDPPVRRFRATYRRGSR